MQVAMFDEKGDVLIFLPGQEDIEEAQAQL
jgi:HrpA-like RNA helicase